MASPPKLRSLSIENAQDLETLVAQLNDFIKDAGNAFDALMLPNRVVQIERNVSFTTDASGNFSVKFKNRLPAAPSAVLTGQLIERASFYTGPVSAPNPAWEYKQDGMIHITGISGLDASAEYRATFVVLP